MASLVRSCCGLSGCSPPRDESDRINFSATGGFYVQASDGSVTLPAAGYDYDIDWTPMSAGLAPAGMAASFAALARMSEATCGETVPDIATLIRAAKLPHPSTCHPREGVRTPVDPALAFVA